MHWVWVSALMLVYKDGLCWLYTITDFESVHAVSSYLSGRVTASDEYSFMCVMMVLSFQSGVFDATRSNDISLLLALVSVRFMLEL